LGIELQNDGSGIGVAPEQAQRQQGDPNGREHERDKAKKRTFHLSLPLKKTIGIGTNVNARTLTGGLLEQPVESEQKNWDSDEKGREEQPHHDQDDRRQLRVLVVSGGMN
jgi:hypothetical protein